MRLTRWSIMIFMLWICASAHAQEEVDEHHDLPLRSTGDLQVFAETAAFRGPEGLTRFEVYTLIDARQLQFVPESGKYVSQIDFVLSFQDSTGGPFKREFWTRNVSVDNIRELKRSGALVRDVVAIDVKPGP